MLCAILRYFEVPFCLRLASFSRLLAHPAPPPTATDCAGEIFGYGAILQRSGVAAARLPNSIARLGWLVSAAHDGGSLALLMVSLRFKTAPCGLHSERPGPFLFSHYAVQATTTKQKLVT